MVTFNATTVSIPMKTTIITIIILCTAIFATAQISVTKIDYRETIVIKADTMSVDAAFRHLDKVCAGNMWYFNRLVIKDNIQYLRFGVPLFRRSTRVIDQNGKTHKIKI